MNNIDKALIIIKENIDISDFSDGISDESILCGEIFLGVKFPREYYKFIKEFGAGNIFGIEIYGIIKNPNDDGDAIPNAIWITLDERKKSKILNNFVIVGDTGDGGYYILDCSIDNKGEIHLFFDGVVIERVAKDFGTFLLNNISYG